MSMKANPRAVALVLVLVLAGLAVAGCTLNKAELRRDDLLKRVGGKGQLIEPKRCALQVAFLIRPVGDLVLGDGIWNAADEQVVAPEVRRALEVNGLRLGLIAGPLPAEVEALLKDDAPEKEKAVRSQIDLPDGGYTPISLSESTPLASLLLRDEGRASGKDYHDASGWYHVTAAQEGATGVALRFVPEIHHGPIQHAFRGVPTGGSLAPQQFMLKDGQEEETFRELAASLTLQPGQVAVLGCRPERDRSVGTFLFTQPEVNSDRMLQKVLLIWASRSSQGLPPLEPIDPPDRPRPRSRRQKEKAEGMKGHEGASPKGDPPVQSS